MRWQRVLDLASGTGTLAIWIKQRESLLDITGVDVDPAILARAARTARVANFEVRFDRAPSYRLPYPATHFDRVVSSLFFQHLTRQDKMRTAMELLRVLRPGGELHVADWGRPTNFAMRGLTTRVNVEGRLVALIEQARFTDVSERQTFSTIYGTMALYRAVKPGG